MASRSALNKSVGVIGAGSFGIAVANLLADNADVLVYVRRQEVAAVMKQTRFLAGQKLASNIAATYELQMLVECCTVIFLFVPSQAFKALLKKFAPLVKPHHILIHGTKGLDVSWPPGIESEITPPLTRDHVKTMSELIQSESNVWQVGCLAGPTLVLELAQRQPTAAVLASPSKAVIAQGKKLLQSKYFQVYASSDLLGTELCSVLKNIIALGVGCLAGLGYGENTKACLISRGLAEMIRLGRAMGASVRPFIGLAGIGDLIATCAGQSSRNYTVGYYLARGSTLSQILARKIGTVEGIPTVKIIYGLIKHYQIKAPITETMYKVLFEGLTPQRAITYLLQFS